jgi:hypothetical protein
VKRLCLLCVALAGLLTAGITTAASARPAAAGAKKPVKVKKAPKPKPVVTKATCKLALATQPPADDTSITPGTTGVQYGTANCGKVRGVVSDTYTMDAAGDIIAPYTLWSKTGTLVGKMTLNPTEQVGPPSTTPFTAQTYAGTATVTTGTGAWNKSTGKATVKCSTLDSVHYSCTESLKVTTPPVFLASK